MTRGTSRLTKQGPNTLNTKAQSRRALRFGPGLAANWYLES